MPGSNPQVRHCTNYIHLVREALRVTPDPQFYTQLAGYIGFRDSAQSTLARAVSTRSRAPWAGELSCEAVFEHIGRHSSRPSSPAFRASLNISLCKWLGPVRSDQVDLTPIGSCRRLQGELWDRRPKHSGHLQGKLARLLLESLFLLCLAAKCEEVQSVLPCLIALFLGCKRLFKGNKNYLWSTDTLF